jgi:four helix bundle protein
MGVAPKDEPILMNPPNPNPGLPPAPSPARPPLLDHKKLTVYQEAIAFVVWVESIVPKLPKKLAVTDQLDRASTSIPLNIAEGNGKFTGPDRCRFFDIARGSALESAACLDVLVARKVLTANDIASGKARLVKIVSMLVGLIRSNSANRVHEEPGGYRAGKAEKQE